MKQLKVDPIKDGTVIDHIPAGRAFKLIDILKLTENDQVMIGTNLSSAKLNKKDIIKIENRELSEDEVNMVALIAPGASFTIIREYKTIKKAKVSMPNIVKGFITCPNEKCITRVEEVVSKFEITNKDQNKVRCMYCEKVFRTEDLNRYITI